MNCVCNIALLILVNLISIIKSDFAFVFVASAVVCCCCLLVVLFCNCWDPFGLRLGTLFAFYFWFVVVGCYVLVSVHNPLVEAG